MDERPPRKRAMKWESHDRPFETSEFVKNAATFLAVARENIGEMSVASLHVLMIVAVRPNLSVKGIATAAGLSQAGTSRILDTLGYRKRRGEPGLGLVEAIGLVSDNRRRLYRLSRAGERASLEWINAYHKRKRDVGTPHYWMGEYQPRSSPSKKSSENGA